MSGRDGRANLNGNDWKRVEAALRELLEGRVRRTPSEPAYRRTLAKVSRITTRTTDPANRAFAQQILTDATKE